MTGTKSKSRIKARISGLLNSSGILRFIIMEDYRMILSFIHISMNKGLTNTKTRKTSIKQGSHYLKSSMRINSTDINSKTLAMRGGTLPSVVPLPFLGAQSGSNSELKTTHLLSHYNCVADGWTQVSLSAVRSAVCEVKLIELRYVQCATYRLAHGTRHPRLRKAESQQTEGYREP